MEILGNTGWNAGNPEKWFFLWIANFFAARGFEQRGPGEARGVPAVLPNLPYAGHWPELQNGLSETGPLPQAEVTDIAVFQVSSPSYSVRVNITELILFPALALSYT